jgi:HAD superfamily hydrolase (TIGR01490 family)
VPNNIAKEKFISHFFKGWEIIRFQNVAKNYSITQIDKIVRVEAIERIKWHKERGHKVVIVSASIEGWLKGWCNNYNLELLSTKLEVKNEKITGKFLTKNCYGIEKVKRIKEVYNLEEFKVIYAYGDSKGDKEMLSIADEKFYKYFE